MTTTLSDLQASILDSSADWDVIDGVIQGGWRHGYLDLSNLNLLDIDLIDGGAGNDTIIGSNGGDIIRGGRGNDVLRGGDGDDVFLNEGRDQGSDQVNGGAGFDTILGGTADDVIGVAQHFDAANSIEVIDGGAGTDSLQGSWRNNIMDFSGTELRGIELIDGGSGNDTITGSAGDDTIRGGIGNDILDGGDGNDVFLYDGADQNWDSINGGKGFDTILGGAADDVIGLGDTFDATNSIEVIDGGGGTDVLQGSWRNDVMDFTGTELRNIERIDGGNGQDTIFGSEAADTIQGANGNDILVGGAGDDRFLVQGSGHGFDEIDGGNGQDSIQGSADDDVIGLWGDFSAENSIESIDGGAGTDTVQGGWTHDTWDFSSVELRNVEAIDGGGGNDVITGSQGSDSIFGGDGNDTLIADGAGGDAFAGGAGVDTLVFDGNRTDYVVNGVAGTVTHGSGVVDRFGADIEFLGFADEVVATADLEGGPLVEPPFQLSGNTLEVGIGKTFATVQEAWAVAEAGDTLMIYEGTYQFSGNEYYSRYDDDHPLLVNQDLAIIGVGDVVFNVGTVSKGALVVAGEASLYVENISFTGANNTSLNGAGIRHQGNDLTVVNSTFTDNQNGILGSGDGTGQEIRIIGSQFVNNGAGDGFSHGIYVGTADSLIIEDSEFRDTNIGHHVKSLAANTVVRNSILDDGNGTASMNIDVTAGGDLLVEGNQIIQSPNSDNPRMIWYSTDRGGEAGTITIRDNEFINELDGGPLIGVSESVVGISMVLENNQITDPSGIESISNNPFQSTGNVVNGEAIADGTYDPAMNFGTYRSEVIDFSQADLDLVAYIDGAGGSDTIIGTNGDDFIIGGAGNDSLQGGGGNDQFIVSGTDQGQDEFSGGAGVDTISGGDDDDTIGIGWNLDASHSIEAIDGGAGTNVIQGSWRHNTMDFSATEVSNIDLIDGGGGHDTITGSTAEDMVQGGGGNDVYVHRASDQISGVDHFDGGLGTDEVRIEFNSTADYAAGYQELMALLDSFDGGAAGSQADNPQIIGLTLENVEKVTVTVEGEADPMISYSVTQPDNAVITSPDDLGA
ncbi:calcium-binding protein [Magnetospira sp. QH-2]|uniref:calcium-binding protein n=1 Tax=Magnetospira sp. (strain QH-2) TaxID=1288970 RepID=UPI0003E81173|nr:calcium-binding protein [Magnetospira sp. QH-2]CCQ72937.1 protein of unknown function [Haemolysin-type calcium-binding region] [Magnetospira sp. QH-2]